MKRASKKIIKSIKEKVLPFMWWLPELKNKKVLKADIIAWITVALVLIPQSMAYAQLAGLPPYVWLYASFLPVMIAAFWWSSRQLATWPVAIVSLMTAAALEPLATSNPENYITYAALLALIVWVFQLSLWILKMWIIVDFLSHPVVVWFTNAAAIIIWTSQLNKIFWLKFWQELTDWTLLLKAQHNYETIYNVIVASLNNTNLTTLYIWLWSILLLVLMKKYAPRLPSVLFAVVIFTLISYFTDFEWNWWSVVWKIEWWLPSFVIPTLDYDIIKQLLSTAIIISLIGFMEAISIAKSMASKTKQWLSANQELIGQWLSNLWSWVFWWYPVSGSFSRSAVNFSAWAKTWFSSIVTWVIVAITLLFLTPLLYHLPQATLAAVIMVAVAWLIKFEPIKHAWKIEKLDAVVAIITFIITLLVAPHLEKWIIVWVVLSLFFFLARSMRPKFIELSMYKDKTFRDAEQFWLKTSNNIWIYRFDWPLYFANAWYFEWKLLKYIASKPRIKVLILDFNWIEEIDSSWHEVLENMVWNFKKAWITTYFARVSWKVLKTFKSCWFLEHFWKENMFSKKTYAIDFVEKEFKDKFKADLQPIREYTPIK